MPFGDLHVAYVNFFLEYKSAFNNDHFLHYRNGRRISLLPDRRHGGNDSPDGDMIDLHPGVRKGLIDMMFPYMCHRLETHGVASNRSPRHGQVFSMQDKGRLAGNRHIFEGI
jgi:hypothetical protein